MKKESAAVLFTGLIVMFSLLSGGCSNIMTPSSPQKNGKGTVTVSFSAGRAALSPVSMNFDQYEFTFRNAADNAPVSAYWKAPNASLTFSLDAGTYILEVKAYKGGSGDGNLAAQGSSDAFTVSASATTPVYVKLNGVLSGGADGTFSYFIQYPLDASIEEITLQIDDANSIDLTKNAVTASDTINTISGTVNTAAGWYFLIVQLSKGDGSGAGYTNGIVIYPGQTTNYGDAGDPAIFEAGDFKAGPIENTGEQVYDWHDLRIDGSRTPWSSDTVGTLYKTYTDEDGTYTDVLKLSPHSSDGYPDVSVALDYFAPIAGEYSISAQVFVEKQNLDDITILWQCVYDQGTGDWGTLTGDRDGNNWIPVPDGQWIPLVTTTAVRLDEGDILALLTNTTGKTLGLKDAVIYIKNLQLSVTSDDGETTMLIDTTVPDGSVTGVKVSPSSVTVAADSTVQLTTQIFPSYAGNKNVSWSTSNPSVAAVSADGLVSAVAEGTAVITVTSADGGKVSQSTVTVNPAAWTEPKYIALTFDDGPDPDPSRTTKLLGILQDKDVKATFFLVGERVEANPNLAWNILSQGHEIGAHSWSHDYGLYDVSDYPGNDHSPAAFINDMMRTQDAIETATLGATGTTPLTPVYCRAPGLYYSPQLYAGMAAMGLPIIGCESTDDWYDPARDGGAMSNPPPERTVANAMSVARPWGILLFHDYGDNGGNTVDAIPVIIDNLRAEGYTILNVGQMLAMQKARYLEPGRVYDDLADVAPDPLFPSDGVIKEATGISVSETNITLPSGDTHTLTASVVPVNATRNKLFWYSENERVATVDSGVVSAKAAGTAVIRVVGGGKTAKVTVTVEPAPLPPAAVSWNVFNFGGDNWTDIGVSSSNAYGTVGDFTDANEVTYSNVLKLVPPSDPVLSSIAMTYTLPQIPGQYRLSMQVWVEKKNADDDVQIFWNSYDRFSDKWGNIGGDQLPVNGGEWITVSTPEGYLDLDGGDLIMLLARNWVPSAHYYYPETGTYYDPVGLNGATLYIRDLKLTCDDTPIIDIPSTATLPATPGLHLDWANGPVTLDTVVSNGDFISRDASAGILTIRQGGTVTITPEGGSSWQWTIDRAVVSNDKEYQFTGTNTGTYKILLKVDGTQEGNTITIVVE